MNLRVPHGKMECRNPGGVLDLSPMKIVPDLEPALVAISGGLGDIGRAIADRLHEAGAEIALADVTEAPPDVPYYSQTLDVTNPDAVERWFEAVRSHFHRVPNIIVPIAGMATFKPHLEISAAEWKREMDVNLNGAFYFAESGARRLAATGRPGRIIFMGSWVGVAPYATLPAYCASKAGLRMLSRTMALGLASKGILVNEIAPGFVNAGLTKKHYNEQPGLEEKARESVPIRKLITADDVAMQVLYLCSPAGVHVTGTTLLQDGGLSLLQGPPPPTS